MVQYRRNQELLYERPEALPEDRQPDTQPRSGRSSQQARAESRTLLTEAEAKEVLAAYGMPVSRTRSLPRRSTRPSRPPAEIGYPVVLKLLSPTITHKSDVGGVQLNLGDETAVRAAFAAHPRPVWRNAARRGVRRRDGAADDPRQAASS